MLKLKKHIKTYGLPRSGTNFLEFVLRMNFSINIPMIDKGGWKHTDFPRINSIIPSIYILKHPLSWFVSIYKFSLSYPEIFELENELSFDEFLLSKYTWNENVTPIGKENGLFEKKISFSDPIECWNEMNQKWSKRCSFKIRYESLLGNNDLLLEIEKKFKLKRKTKDFLWPVNELKPGDGFCWDDSGIITKSVFKYPEKEYTSYYSRELLKSIESKINYSIY